MYVCMYIYMYIYIVCPYMYVYIGRIFIFINYLLNFIIPTGENIFSFISKSKYPGN